MIIKGILKSVDYLNNTGIVRLPRFETAGTKDEMTMPCVFAIPPGVYNGYKESDIVWVAFETGNYGEPVVIGKLYLGATTEGTKAGGSGKYSDFIVTNSASIPISTTLTSGNAPTVKNIEVVQKYPTILSITEDLQAVKTQVQKGVTEIFQYSNIETPAGTWESKTLFQRSIKYTSGTTMVDLPVLDGPSVAYDNIFIDISHSYYYKGLTTIANITTGEIYLGMNKISVPATAQYTTACVTILYTKKQIS